MLSENVKCATKALKQEREQKAKNMQTEQIQRSLVNIRNSAHTVLDSLSIIKNMEYELSIELCKKCNLEELRNDLNEIKNIVNIDNGFIGLEESTYLKLINWNNLAKSQINSEWKDITYNQGKNIADGLLSLSELLSFGDKPKIVATNILNSIRTEPKKVKDIIEFKKNLKSGTEMLDTLELTNEIKVFITKITKKVATVNDLNPNIIEWINKHNLGNKIKLGF